MAKTQEELNQLKVEYETLNNKLKELSDDELKLVTGGSDNKEVGYNQYPCSNFSERYSGDYICGNCWSYSMGFCIAGKAGAGHH